MYPKRKTTELIGGFYRHCYFYYCIFLVLNRKRLHHQLQLAESQLLRL